MYAAIVGRKVSEAQARVWRAMVLRSGMLTALVLAVLLGGLILIVRERGKGHLAQLERELHSKPVPQGPVMPPLGGQDAIVLDRSASASTTSAMPEFVSATMLPGRDERAADYGECAFAGQDSAAGFAAAG